MGWITINGAHIEIGDDGKPTSELGKKLLKERSESDPKIQMAVRGSSRAVDSSEKAFKSGEDKDNTDARKSHFASMETHIRIANEKSDKDSTKRFHEQLVDHHHAMAELHKAVSIGSQSLSEIKEKAKTYTSRIKEDLGNI